MSVVTPHPEVNPPVSNYLQEPQEKKSNSGWEKIACSLETCIDSNTKLVAASIEQNEVNKTLAVSGQFPKVQIPIFSGDPLQYPVWKTAFTTLIDSKPMDSKTKLSFLNQLVTGKPKQVVEHYLLIGTDDAYKKAIFMKGMEIVML